MANNVVFSISTELEMDGRQLKALKPNSKGIYEGIPLTVVGTHSRNNVNYEKQSVLNCLTDKNSRFAMNIASGDCEGEWGHPFLAGDNILERLLYIDRTKVSHCFTKVYGKEMENGLIIIYGDVKPFGPFKQNLIDSFEDPSRNTSFSLRSATAVTGKIGGIVQKKMLALVTFDAVDGPGYLQASKRFQDLAASTENLGIDIDPKNAYNVSITATKEQYLKSQEAIKLAGQESIITDQQILDAFGCDKVVVRDRVLNRIGKDQFSDGAGRVSLFDLCFHS